ncbi:helix-turn-helix domain-containing protein [Runella zeae]|uniref:helix-turn-helix domain-containing protein n=1 Tax=Runella zeae TaxID=94255 RepID=UPI002353CFC2|nr:helix-turn-helix transcriptional regulator [Runella zeae]
MTVGERLKQIRGRVPLREFAEPLGVTATQISAIEHDKSGLSVDLAIKIAKIHNVSLDWLLMGEETKPQNSAAQQNSPSEYITITKDELIELQRHALKTKTDALKELENELHSKNIHQVLRSEP